MQRRQKVSVCGKGLKFNPSNFLDRLTSEISEMGLVVRETVLTNVLSQSRWQHVVLSYVEALDGSTLAGKVLTPLSHITDAF